MFVNTYEGQTFSEIVRTTIRTVDPYSTYDDILRNGNLFRRPTTKKENGSEKHKIDQSIQRNRNNITERGWNQRKGPHRCDNNMTVAENNTTIVPPALAIQKKITIPTEEYRDGLMNHNIDIYAGLDHKAIKTRMERGQTAQVEALRKKMATKKNYYGGSSDYATSIKRKPRNNEQITNMEPVRIPLDKENMKRVTKDHRDYDRNQIKMKPRPSNVGEAIKRYEEITKQDNSRGGSPRQQMMENNTLLSKQKEPNSPVGRLQRQKGPSIQKGAPPLGVSSRQTQIQTKPGELASPQYHLQKQNTDDGEVRQIGATSVMAQNQNQQQQQTKSEERISLVARLRQQYEDKPEEMISLAPPLRQPSVMARLQKQQVTSQTKLIDLTLQEEQESKQGETDSVTPHQQKAHEQSRILSKEPKSIVTRRLQQYKEEQPTTEISALAIARLQKSQSLSQAKRFDPPLDKRTIENLKDVQRANSYELQRRNSFSNGESRRVTMTGIIERQKSCPGTIMNMDLACYTSKIPLKKDQDETERSKGSPGTIMGADFASYSSEVSFKEEKEEEEEEESDSWVLKSCSGAISSEIFFKEEEEEETYGDEDDVSGEKESKSHRLILEARLVEDDTEKQRAQIRAEERQELYKEMGQVPVAKVLNKPVGCAKNICKVILSLVIMTAIAATIVFTKKNEEAAQFSASEAPTSSPWPEWVNTFQAFSTPESPWLIMDLSSDGKVLAVGHAERSSEKSFRGIVKVFEHRGGGIWVRRGGDLVGDVAGHAFGGYAVLSGDGNRLAVGSEYFDTSNYLDSTGAITIYDYDNDSDSWATVGSPITGISSYASAAPLSISSNGAVLAVCGASSKHSFTTIYIFNNSIQEWIPIGDQIFGSTASLSRDGRRVAVGEPAGRGSVTIYDFFDDWGGGWDVVGEIDGSRSTEKFGSSVSLSEDGARVAIGAPSGYLDIFLELYGTVVVFEYADDDDAWTPLGNKLGGESSNGSIGKSGSVSLSASGEYLAVGSGSFVQVYQFLDNYWDPIGENSISMEGSTVSLSGDGTVVAAASEIQANSGTIRVFEVSSSHTASPTPQPSTPPVAPSDLPSAAPSSSPTIGCGDDEAKFQLELLTDARGFQIEWFLTNGAGDMVESRPLYSYGVLKLYEYETCLPLDCYRFVMMDNYGKDGLCCENGEGYYAVSINGEEIQRGTQFGFPGDIIDFGDACATPTPLECDGGAFLLQLAVDALGFQQAASYRIVQGGSGVILLQGSLGSETGARKFVQQVCVETDACMIFTISDPYSLSYDITLGGHLVASSDGYVFDSTPEYIRIGNC